MIRQIFQTFPLPNFPTIWYHVRPYPVSFCRYPMQEQLLTFTHGMLLNDSYVYTDHLLALDSCINPDPQSVNILSLEVYSPLNLHQWMQDLQLHPDKDFSSYILRVIREGFRLSFNRNQHFHSSTSNLHYSNLSVIYEYLEREVSL